MPDLGPIAGELAPIVGRAIGIIARTTAGMVALGLVCGGACAWIAADGSWVRGVAGALVAIVLFGVVAVLVAIKRALLGAVAMAVSKIGVGRRITGLLFGTMLGVRDDARSGPRARGGAIARAAERIPLAQAEVRLREAVFATMKGRTIEPGFRGWLARKVEVTVVDKVAALSLGRFRELGAQEGGVDLARVRDELAASADKLIEQQVDRVAVKITAIAALGAMAASLLVALTLRHAFR